MRRAALVVYLGVALVGCSREHNVTPNSAQTAATSATATAPPTATPGAPSASAAAAPKASAPKAADFVHCLSAEERERDLSIEFKLRNKLAVVRVAPDDVLWVREGPGADSKQVGKLSFDARDIAATGRVCRAGEALWFEVSSGATRGFANGSFLVPATVPVEETSRFSKAVGGSAFANVEALAQALGRAHERERTEPSEVRFETKLVGVARNGARAVLLLYACCYADDSVMGEQIYVDAVERSGLWTLERARVSRLCPRGASGAVCI
jgi:hypothetical protein